MSTAVGNLIKELRQSSGITQSSLGRKTRIAAARISKIESGTIKASPDEIAAIATYFQRLDIIRAYWQDSPVYDAAIRICDRMGIQVQSDIAATARQFGEDIIRRTQHIIQTCEDLPDDPTQRHEHLVLMEQEALAVGNLATALRMMIGEVHGK